jgi:uncharacterized GH25 family protein
MRRLVLALLLLLASAATGSAHDLFIRFDNYFLAPKSHVVVRVLNGTFTTSENAVTADRLADLSVASLAQVTRLPNSAWTEAGKRSELQIETGAPGTYAVGASTKPRSIKLAGKAFNAYLTEEGITGVLADRGREHSLDRPARERYSKHVKAIFQVGDSRTADYSHFFGYPAEIVPVENPYRARAGQPFRVRCLVDGQPVEGLTVLAGVAPADGVRPKQYSSITDEDGMAIFPAMSSGVWYVKFVHMVKATAPEFDYESKWATLTFAIR